MRRALVIPLALAAALAACSVDVEGARCSNVGTTDNCPAGQACGTGLTCSVRAASCTPCVAGTHACSADTTGVATCTGDDDPACGSMKVAASDVCAAGQACRLRNADNSPTCACTTWTVVPGAAPTACIQPAIKLAIDEAVKFPNPRVLLGGVAPATYGSELADVAPIIIPANVALIGDNESAAAAPNRIIAVQGPGPEGLQVHAGAIVQGVAIQRAAGGPTVGVLVSEGSAVSGNTLIGDTLISVRIDAGGAGGGFATGLRIAGGNTVSVSDVLVKGATVAGLEVIRLGPTDVVQVSQSTFDGNQVGVSLLKGDLRLAGSTVKRSTWEGFVSATGTPGMTGFAIQDSFITWNGRGGMRLSVNDTVSILRTRICGNTGFDRTYSGVTRKVGGLYVVGNPPLTAIGFTGNLIHSNQGDQVYVGAASTTWNLSGAAGCAAADRNVLADYTAPGVGISAVGASVAALFNAWGNAFPLAGTDYFASPSVPIGSVDAGTGGGATDFCGAALPADLVCPLP
jgi:hypothetical protein